MLWFKDINQQNPYQIETDQDPSGIQYILTNIVNMSHEKSVLKIKVNKQEFIIRVFQSEDQQSTHINLKFKPEQNIEFSLIGQGQVQLQGTYYLEDDKDFIKYLQSINTEQLIKSYIVRNKLKKSEQKEEQSQQQQNQLQISQMSNQYPQQQINNIPQVRQLLAKYHQKTQKKVKN